jgi:hypothetical protein
MPTSIATERATSAHPSSPRAKHAGLTTLLRDHHVGVESACLALMGAAFVDDPPTLAMRWNAFEDELGDHMAAEEELLIPSYASADPDQAQELIADHILIRDLLEGIALDVELHTIRIEPLKALVELLREHARREEATIYPWAHRHLPTLLRRQLAARLGKLHRHT